jgi:predicted amidohydrolase
MPIQTETITVAAAQLPARSLSQAAEALADITTAVAESAQAGARLVVLPECCYPAYWLGSRDRYFQADVLRGPALETWFGNLAREHRITIIAGLVREQDGVLYDAAVLFDASGRLRGLHRKTFLWDAEHNWFNPGDLVRPVETEGGSIGMVICAEGRCPEVFASHAVQGAGLLAMPTAWVNAGAPGAYYNPQPDFLIQARAREFGLPIVCANKFGWEDGQAQFCGMSMIVSGDGKVVAKAPPDEPALLLASVRIASRRLLLPEETVRRLLAPTAPVPPPANAKPLRAVLVPPGLTCRQDEQTLAIDFGAHMVVNFACMAEAQAASADSRLPRLKTIAHAKVGFLTAEQARSFAWPRILAMDGAQVLCVTGPRVDLPLLRTRALENRVFLMAAPDGAPVVSGPDGQVAIEVSAKSSAPQVLDMEIAQAACKMVAPQTHIWAERRREAYCLTLPSQ